MKLDQLKCFGVNFTLVSIYALIRRLFSSSKAISFKFFMRIVEVSIYNYFTSQKYKILMSSLLLIRINY